MLVERQVHHPVDNTRLDELMLTFYRVPRAGAVRLSDGGGPFGFDIYAAVQIEFAVIAYECDAVIETGCFLGDTTEYLARRYSDLPILTCDIIESHTQFTRQRLAQLTNLTILTGDSATLLPEMVGRYERPLVYLDAHWNEQWPLRAELASIDRGVVCIDDFFIGHPRFAFDTYHGQPCAPALVADTLPDLAELYVGSPYPSHGIPCLQVGRRCGRAYIPRGLDPAPLAATDLFVPVPLRPAIRMPDWAAYESHATAGLTDRHG